MAVSFTKRELEIATRVLAGTKAAKAWAEGEAKSFSVDLNTPNGQAYYDRARLHYAQKLLKGATD